MAKLSYADQLAEDIARLPTYLGLCPICQDEFYYPLSADEIGAWQDGKAVHCPSESCGPPWTDEPTALVIFRAIQDPTRRDHHA